MNKLNLKTQRPPAPAPAASTLPPVTAGPRPLPAGIVRYEDLSPVEQSALQNLNWPTGTAVPANMADIIAHAQALDEQQMQAHLNQPGLGPVTTVPITELPQDRQSQLLQHVREAAAQMQKQQEEAATAAAAAHLPPSIQDGLRVAQEGLRTPVLPPVTATPSSPPPTPSNPPTSPLEPPAPEPDTAELSSDTGVLDVTNNCPQCGWDQNKQLEVTPTDQDKARFLVELLGLTPAARFRKEYNLLNGRLILGFRSLTTGDRQLIQQQVASDVRRGELGDDSVLTITLAADTRTVEYLMCASLDYVEAGGIRKYDAPALLADIEFDAVDEAGKPFPEKTAVRALRDHLIDAVFPSESLRQLVAKYFLQFHQLYTLLTANAGNESFYKGIEASSA